MVVVGAGPAGATAALNLAPRRSVALVERTALPSDRIGESLAPVAGRLLSHMGLLESFLQQAHHPWHGNVAVWGGPRPYHRDFVHDVDGNGWHLDRVRFEQWLRRLAVARGARLFAPAWLHDLRRSRGRWALLIGAAREARWITADLVLDAGGRSAPVARRLGVRRRTYDRLICAWVRGAVRHGELRRAVTYVEAAEEGWWYSAATPAGTRVLAFHTDADLISACQQRDPSTLLRLAFRHAQLRELLAATGFEPGSAIGFTTAHTALLEPVAGDAWLAAGDAASSIDPLASQGLLNALATGLRAAQAGDRYLSGVPDALSEYAARVRVQSERLRDGLRSQYESEKRWPDSPFWARRHSTAA